MYTQKEVNGAPCADISAVEAQANAPRLLPTAPSVHTIYTTPVQDRRAKRRAQNRESQKAFRKRKAEQEEQLLQDHQKLQAQCTRLTNENEGLRELLSKFRQPAAPELSLDVALTFTPQRPKTLSGLEAGVSTCPEMTDIAASEGNLIGRSPQEQSGISSRRQTIGVRPIAGHVNTAAMTLDHIGRCRSRTFSSRLGGDQVAVKNIGEDSHMSSDQSTASSAMHGDTSPSVPTPDSLDELLSPTLCSYTPGGPEGGLEGNVNMSSVNDLINWVPPSFAVGVRQQPSALTPSIDCSAPAEAESPSHAWSASLQASRLGAMDPVSFKCEPGSTDEGFFHLEDRNDSMRTHTVSALSGAFRASADILDDDSISVAGRRGVNLPRLPL